MFTVRETIKVYVKLFKSVYKLLEDVLGLSINCDQNKKLILGSEPGLELEQDSRFIG